MKRMRKVAIDFGFLISFADLMSAFGVLAFLLVLVFMLLRGQPDSTPTPKMLPDLVSIVESMQKMKAVIESLEKNLDETGQKLADANENERRNAINFTDKYRDSLSKQAEQRKQTELAEAEAAEVKGGANAVRKNRATRVIFCTDGSASMADGLNSRRGNAMMFASVMPTAMTRFELGFLTFRGDELNEFPLRRILPVESDQGQSVAEVRAYLESIDPKGGETCVAAAIDAAISQLEKQSSEFGAEILCVIADVGPGDIAGYDQNKGRMVIERVRRWANRPDRNRRVITIQTGGGDTAVNLKQHEPFFTELAAVNKQSRFSKDLAALFPLVFKASFVTEGS